MPDHVTNSGIRHAGVSHGTMGAPVARSQTDLNRPEVRLEHAGLEGRSQSMPHAASRPPRAGLPAPSMEPASGPSGTHPLLDTAERSDRFSTVANARDSDGWSQVDLDHERAPTPPAERSWRALAGSVLARAGEAGRAAADWAGDRYQAASAAVIHGTKATYQATSAAVVHGAQVTYGAVRDQTVQSAEAVGLLLPGKRTMGALAGHLAHQSVTVGGPTFLREMMAEAMVHSMRHMPPSHAVMLQTGMAVVSVGAQVMRELRERRNPDEAARGFHGLSPQQWNELSDTSRATLRKAQRQHSRMVTLMQVTASGTHIAIGVMAAKGNDAGKAGKLFATDFKTMVYGGMRDSLQASFSLVGTERDTYGVGGAHMTASAMFYGGANIAANYAFTVLPAMVPGAELADDVLLGKSDAMTHGDAWQTKAAVSAVKAAINTILEASDWFSVTQQEANQAGTVQQFQPRLRLTDYGRLLDQTPARMVAIGGSNAMYNAITFAMKDQPQAAQDLVANVVVGAFAGVQYKTIGGTWQANGAVRENPVPQQPERDLERGA